MHKQGHQHVLIGVTSFSNTPEKNLSWFEKLFGLKCGDVTAFCDVAAVRQEIEDKLDEMGAEYCHAHDGESGLNADVP